MARLPNRQGTTEVELEQFCRAEYPRLVACLTLYCRDHAVAEELTQETLVRVVSNWQRVAMLDSPGGWAHHVAMNLARSWFRRTAASVRAARRLDRTAVSASAESSVDVLALAEELKRLPDRQRIALILRHVAGLSPDEAGEVMHCSAQAVRNLAHRGSTELRRRLTGPLSEG